MRLLGSNDVFQHRWHPNNSRIRPNQELQRLLPNRCFAASIPPPIIIAPTTPAILGRGNRAGSPLGELRALAPQQKGGDGACERRMAAARAAGDCFSDRRQSRDRAHPAPPRPMAARRPGRYRPRSPPADWVIEPCLDDTTPAPVDIFPGFCHAHHQDIAASCRFRPAFGLYGPVPAEKRFLINSPNEPCRFA